MGSIFIHSRLQTFMSVNAISIFMFVYIGSHFCIFFSRFTFVKYTFVYAARGFSGVNVNGF